MARTVSVLGTVVGDERVSLGGVSRHTKLARGTLQCASVGGVLTLGRIPPLAEECHQG